MASVNGTLSPLPHPDPADSSFSLSAKRKRDDSVEIQHQASAINDFKYAAGTTSASVEDQRSLIRDLVDVLKR